MQRYQGHTLSLAAAVREDRWSMDSQKVPQGMGSGFFWDDKGHIVTNFHVIKGAADIKVALIDQSVWSAKVSPAVTCFMQVHAYTVHTQQG